MWVFCTFLSLSSNFLLSTSFDFGSQKNRRWLFAKTRSKLSEVCWEMPILEWHLMSFTVPPSEWYSCQDQWVSGQGEGSTLYARHFEPLLLIHKDSPRHLGHGLLIETFNQLQRVQQGCSSTLWDSWSGQLWYIYRDQIVVIFWGLIWFQVVVGVEVRTILHGWHRNSGGFNEPIFWLSIFLMFMLWEWQPRSRTAHKWDV